MCEGTSISKGPLVAKILIDYSEYKDLLQAKEFRNRYEKEFKEGLVVNLELEDRAEDQEDRKEKEEKLDDNRVEKEIPQSSVEQIGQGVDLRTLISELIREELKKSVQSFEQKGSGATDLAPIVLTPIENPDHQPPSAEVSSQKSIQNSEIDRQLLLKKLRPKSALKATRLLEGLNEDPNSVTWNSDGIIFINGDSIPDSNIFLLIPEIYKTNPKRNLPGFFELVSEIGNLGLGHLIGDGILKGLQRLAPIGNQRSLYQEVKGIDNWWFIGAP
jgi:hypothetical protein